MYSAARRGRIVSTLINATHVINRYQGDKFSHRCSRWKRKFTSLRHICSFLLNSSTIYTNTAQPQTLQSCKAIRRNTHLLSAVLDSHLMHKELIVATFSNNRVFSKLCGASRQYHTSNYLAAGHNKWSKIKHRKTAADIERSKMISRYTAAILTAIRIGGSDPDNNIRLENAILQARQARVPKATIENAICSATVKHTSSAEFLLYDARGPSGYHMLIEVLSDNKRKTRPEIRNLLSKNGGMLGEPGSSGFVFEHKGVVRIPKSQLDSNTDPLEIAIEVGAEDIIEEDNDTDDIINNDVITEEDGGEKEENEGSDQQEVDDVSEEDYIQLKCEPTALNSVSTAVKAKGLTVASASLEYLPTSYVTLDKAQYERALRMVELLQDHDDVVEVYDNFQLARSEGGDPVKSDL